PRTVTVIGACWSPASARVAPRLFGAAARLGRLGIRRAHVEDGGEHGEERLAYARQILKGEPAFVHLSLLDALVDNARDEPADAARRRLGERARRALDAVGEHQDRRLLRVRLGARVAEVFAA